MLRPYTIPVWKTAPFIRLLVPFIAGIMLQWYIEFSLAAIIIAIVCFTIAFLLFRLFPLSLRFKWKMLQGSILNALLLSIGVLITWQKDIRHQPKWFGIYYQQQDYLVVRINEPPTEKTRSVKAEGWVESIIHNDSIIHCEGKLLLYLSKDSLVQHLHYGDQILINKDLQPIKNSGNPGAFDYKQYCLFRGITYQVYLTPQEFVVLKERDEKWLDKFLYSIRAKVINIIRKYIPGEKEQGLAEAILIGYKDDLDKNLEQSYINTGVVHIIVIAGLHLGMVYWVLVLFARPLKKRAKIKWLVPVIIISGLWLFSLLTGAHPPVMRAAVMLTSVVLAQCLRRKTSVYNTIAFTSFILLCYNPFWLWDPGFQLSYAAVVSIVSFTRPIYNRVHIKNKALNFIWKINAVSISAQLLTIPFSIYYFHQFPNFFLLTNFVAVPLGMLILLGEILLTFISFIKPLAVFTGHILSWLIRSMNYYIERIDALPFSVCGGLQITTLQAVLLIIMVSGLSYWLLEKRKAGLWLGIGSLLFFISLGSISLYQYAQQKKIIVYNVPQHQAIDLVSGNDHEFIGDSTILKDAVLQNLHLKPAMIALQLRSGNDSLASVFRQNMFYQFNNKRMVLIDKAMVFEPSPQKINVDMIIISKSPKLYIPQLAKVFNCKQYIFDASNSLWKIAKWQKDCEALNLQCYSVPEKGAFVFELH